MRIFYTTKRIFWSNEGQDYLESTQFNEFFSGQWIELSNVKSINWTSHYEASFYATDAFEATYFKIEKNNQTYYFFVQDIKNDSANGKFWYLTLDLYNTYGKNFIEQLKTLNPKVTFKRKHANRFFYLTNERTYYFNFNRQRYLLTPPPSTNDLVKNVNTFPKKQRISFPVDRDRPRIYSLEKVFINGTSVTSSKYEFDLAGAWYGDRSSAVYEYIILKRPGEMPFGTKSAAGRTDFFYVFIVPPITSGYKIINYPDGSAHRYQLDTTYTFTSFYNIPSSLVVARIQTAIPPTVFGSCDSTGFIYGKRPGLDFGDDQVYCLSSLGRKTIESTPIFNFLPIDYEAPYNTFEAEPILGMAPFLKITLKQNEVSPLCFFSRVDEGYNKDKWVPIKGSIPFTVVSSSSLFIKPPKGALDDDQTQKFIEATHQRPMYGDVLNEYLLNNTNAINTGIQNKVGSAILGGIGGLVNVGGSIASGNVSGAIQGAVGIGQSIWGVAQSYRNLSATYADLGNKTDDLKDTYGKGVCVGDEDMLAFISYELPVETKQLVFKDIYFSGYLFNGVDNFNTYRNRRIFNYFEITDINQFLNLYTTYPKQIINDLSEKFMNGIRLWRTTAVNFDMSLDNREISFD